MYYCETNVFDKLFINSMGISEIKSQLTLKTVLDYYGLKPDKHLRLNCSFHPDKTPSLQVYYKTHTAYCFSSNCSTHGKSLDVIDFILHKESCSKHEAIEKAKQLITGEATATPIENLTRSAILTKMFIYFKNAIHNSKPAKEYLEERHLDFEKLKVGYNSGQFHHAGRFAKPDGADKAQLSSVESKKQAMIQSCLKVGLLLDQGKKSRTGEPAYQPFGKNGVVFPLKNAAGKVVSLYFRSIIDNSKIKHFYLKNRQGLYPCYPKTNTTKLILTEAIIDAATLLQQKQITDQYEILSLFGTNGLTEEHTKAIKNLTDLEEVIFFFDGDQAGKAAAKKYAEQLTTQHSGLKTSTVATPENEDVNSLLDSHSSEILTELLEQREVFSFSNEESPRPSVDSRPTAVGCGPLDFLKSPNVLQQLNERIGQCGIVGERQSRLLLFLLTLSYQNKRPLHGIVQGSSGSGKTHIISRIADLMPQEDVLRFTRITESSLYNWGEYDLF